MGGRGGGGGSPYTQHSGKQVLTAHTIKKVQTNIETNIFDIQSRTLFQGLLLTAAKSYNVFV